MYQNFYEFFVSILGGSCYCLWPWSYNNPRMLIKNCSGKHYQEKEVKYKLQFRFTVNSRSSWFLTLLLLLKKVTIHNLKKKSQLKENREFPLPAQNINNNSWWWRVAIWSLAHCQWRSVDVRRGSSSFWVGHNVGTMLNQTNTKMKTIGFRERYEHGIFDFSRQNCNHSFYWTSFIIWFYAGCF